MKLALQFPDPEPAVRAWLTDQFEEYGENVTVAIGVPESWSSLDSEQTPHIQVDSDGVPDIRNNLVGFATIRVTAWAHSTGEAKRLAAMAQGLLCGHPGAEIIKGATPLTGVLPARDPETSAELASTTSRVAIRSALIEPTGS